MIESFADKDVEVLLRGHKPRKLKLPSTLYHKALILLQMIDAAETIYDFYHPPSNRFEALGGNRKGQFSLRINDRWRICFAFSDGIANDVEITDHYR